MKTIKSNSTGRNIHSPFMYRLVANVIFAPYPFYSFSEIETFTSDKNELFELKTIFRIINHFNFNEVIISGQKNKNIEKTCLLARSDIKLHYLVPFQTTTQNSKTEDYRKLAIIDEIRETPINSGYPESTEVWIFRNLNLENTNRYFEELKSAAEVQITIKLNQMEMVIFNEILKKQNYVIKHSL